MLPPLRRSAMIPEPTTVAASSSDPRHSPASRRGSGSCEQSLQLADLIDLFAERKSIKTRQWQRHKHVYSPLKHPERVSERIRSERVRCLRRPPGLPVPNVPSSGARAIPDIPHPLRCRRP